MQQPQHIRQLFVWSQRRGLVDALHRTISSEHRTPRFILSAPRSPPKKTSWVCDLCCSDASAIGKGRSRRPFALHVAERDCHWTSLQIICVTRRRNIEPLPKRLKSPSVSKSFSHWPAFATRPPKAWRSASMRMTELRPALTHSDNGSTHDFAVRVRVRTVAIACRRRMTELGDIDDVGGSPRTGRKAV